MLGSGGKTEFIRCKVVPVIDQYLLQFFSLQNQMNLLQLFESNSGVAQLVEQLLHTEKAVGSSPTTGTNASVCQWLDEQTLNLWILVRVQAGALQKRHSDGV